MIEFEDISSELGGNVLLDAKTKPWSLSLKFLNKAHELWVSAKLHLIDEENKNVLCRVGKPNGYSILPWQPYLIPAKCEKSLSIIGICLRCIWEYP